jgi:site-specific DNA-cytosine methylase
MSFPDDFILPEDQSMPSIARQVGNAVPPLLAQRIAEALAIALDAGSADVAAEAAA